MVDPITAFGIGAGAAQLAGCALKSLVNLVNYYRNVRDAPAKSKELRDELDTLVDLLEEIQQSFEPTTVIKLPLSVLIEFENIHQSLIWLCEKAKAKNTQGIGRFKWPLTNANNLEMLGRIGRFKGTLNSILNLRQMYSSIPVLKDVFMSLGVGWRTLPRMSESLTSMSKP
jgi:hypothetical protein